MNLDLSSQFLSALGLVMCCATGVVAQVPDTASRFSGILTSRPIAGPREDRTANRQPQPSRLPDISGFAKNKSDRFVVDMDMVRTGHPYKGTDAERPHTGGHIYFRIPDKPIPAGNVRAFPAIYAVADGYVSRIDEYFKLRPIFNRTLGKPVANHRYGVTLAIARKNGAAVNFHYSIEPMIDPGDPDFYKPFILVKRGQRVKKGDVIARMYIPPRREFAQNTHIHFNLMDTGKRQFMAPTIFEGKIVRRFHRVWGKRGLDGKTRIPPCMGYRLSGPENPFGTGAKEQL